ncbi:MAG: glycosyltransferase [Candidatus Diapherotrites archaeon]|nr:glycosyltransferase [Candidatus Diapherotrites archaeon]
MKPKISVVIPAHNRPDFLENTIRALLAQTLGDFEALVVGFEGNDTFTDDDCLPEKGWLERISVAFEKDKGLAGIEGLTWKDNRELYCHATQNLSGGKFPACNYAFRKEWLESVKGFDESYNFFREDTDLAFKVIEAGGKISFDKNVKVFHPPRKLPLYFPLKELKMLKGDIRLSKKFPALYKKNFGFVCQGSFKQAMVSCLLLWVVAGGMLLRQPLLGTVAAIAGIFLFKYLAEMKGKKLGIAQGIAFTFFSFLRDLLFPQFFLFYWFEIWFF